MSWGQTWPGAVPGEWALREALWTGVPTDPADPLDTRAARAQALALKIPYAQLWMDEGTELAQAREAEMLADPLAPSAVDPDATEEQNAAMNGWRLMALRAALQMDQTKELVFFHGRLWAVHSAGTGRELVYAGGAQGDPDEMLAYGPLSVSDPQALAKACQHVSARLLRAQGELREGRTELAALYARAEQVGHSVCVDGVYLVPGRGALMIGAAAADQARWQAGEAQALWTGQDWLHALNSFQPDWMNEDLTPPLSREEIGERRALEASLRADHLAACARGAALRLA